MELFAGLGLMIAGFATMVFAHTGTAIATKLGRIALQITVLARATEEVAVQLTRGRS